MFVSLAEIGHALGSHAAVSVPLCPGAGMLCPITHLLLQHLSTPPSATSSFCHQFMLGMASEEGIGKYHLGAKKDLSY